MSTSALPGRRVVAAAIALGLLAGLPAAQAGAHGTSSRPEYFVRVRPVSAAAGRTVTATVNVRQLVTTHHDYQVIGSLRVTPPAGFALKAATATQDGVAVPVSIAGGVATAEDLDLRTKGQLLRFTLTTEVRCGTAGTSLWRTNAHEATDYEDTSRRTTVRRHPDSQLTTQVRRCSLAFLRQPALAGAGVAVTSVAADPSGASVAARLLDGDGQPSSQSGIEVAVAIKPGTGTAGATLGGSTSATTNGNGVAAFGPTVDKPGFGYRLVADAGPSVTGATSAAFDVVGVAVRCSGSCTGDQQKGSTSASVAASTNGGLLTLTLGLADVDCDNQVNGWYRATSEPLLFDVTSGTGRSVVTVRIDAASVDRRLDRYQVCFSSPVSSFVNRFHEPIAAGEAGVLHGCPKHFHSTHKDAGPAHHQDPIPVDYQPCLEKRWKDDAGNVYVRFSVPPGDPRAKI